MINEALIVEDENGEPCIQFTDALLKAVGWKEGDSVEWVDQKDGTFLIKKKSTTYFNLLDHEQTK
jgi:hypothetical protein